MPGLSRARTAVPGDAMPSCSGPRPAKTGLGGLASHARTSLTLPRAALAALLPWLCLAPARHPCQANPARPSRVLPGRSRPSPALAAVRRPAELRCPSLVMPGQPGPALPCQAPPSNTFRPGPASPCLDPPGLAAPAAPPPQWPGPPLPVVLVLLAPVAEAAVHLVGVRAYLGAAFTARELSHLSRPYIQPFRLCPAGPRHADLRQAQPSQSGRPCLAKPSRASPGPRYASPAKLGTAKP
jgi:hypothetical protein